MFLSRGDRDLGVAFQTHPGRQAFISTRVRLEKAKNLLRTTDSTIIQIAQEVGYTASYFDNVFKKFEGITPQTYRQRWYDSDTDL